MSTNTPLLEVNNLTKKFGGITAVDGIDWSINDTGIECIIGPNGAGKSTFLKLLIGVHSPTRGEILYKGEEITELETYERISRGISIKQQIASIYENLTVYDNLKIAVQSAHDDEVPVIRSILTEIGLTEQKDQVVRNLSHGAKQWLEIGMAMGIEPDLLLLDEPTAGMSIEETHETATMLKTLAEERSLGIVIIDHDMEFISEVGDQITVFHQGKHFMSGKMEEIEANKEVQRIYLGG